MPLLFVYGSLKQGFANERVNTGVRLAGTYRTRDLLPMYLVGDGHVPCIVLSPGTGHHVVGEVYRVAEQDLPQIDRLERVGLADGYERVSIDLERTDASPPEALSAFVYVKREAAVPVGSRRAGPLPEYTPQHARHFSWQGAA
jgi:gamma-glutamylaminecyclotransferase